jgi:hypothetical protein
MKNRDGGGTTKQEDQQRSAKVGLGWPPFIKEQEAYL